MIINPVKVPAFVYPFSRQTQNIQRNFVTLPYQNDRAEFSFTGIFESSTTPVHLEQAQQHSGIHCPSCGTPMLSEHDFECILNKASQVKNAQELISLIYNNKKFVPPKFSRIFEDMKKIDNAKEMSIPEFREIMSDYAYMNKKQVIHSTRDYLREYAMIVPPDFREKPLKTVDEIKTKQIYQVQKDKIIQFTKDMELNEAQSNVVLSKTLRPIFIANGYYMLFNSSKLPQIPESDYGAFIAERIFYPSVNKISKLSRYPIHDNLENNKVLICNACSQNQPKNVFWRQNNKLVKDNMMSYLTDISYQMGEGEMEFSPDYIDAFTQITGKLSKQQISFTTSEIKAIKNVGRVIKRHERFAPIEQTQVDIPCAECSSVMLPHSKRKVIEKELKECNTPLEYAHVLEKNIKYIGKNSKTLANIFLDIVLKNPQISNEEFLREFVKYEGKYTEKAINNALTRFMEDRTYVMEKYPPECLKIYDIFSKRMLQYFADDKFDINNVSDFFSVCLKDLDLRTYHVKPIFVLVRDLNSISYKHLCATFDNRYHFNDKDNIYTILFNLFKFNVATADHLMPENKGGEGDKYNLIGLCKCCNRAKSQKKVYNWYVDNKAIEHNLKRQLSVIDKMAKSGKIEGYDDWAKTIAQKVFEQTYGKLDLREDYV